MKQKLTPRRIFSLSFTFPALLILLVALFQPSRSYSFQFDATKDFADTNFTLLGEVPTGDCQSVALIGNNYIAVGSGRGVRILDLNATPKIKMVSQIYTGGEVFDLAVEGSYLYVTLVGNSGYPNEFYPIGLVIVDVSNPERPVRKSFVDFSTLSAAHGVAVKDGYVYASSVNEIAIIDATNPENPEIIDHIFIGSIPMKLTIQDNFLFVAAQGHGILIYDISNHTLSLVGSIQEWSSYVAVYNSLLFSFNQSNTIKIYSISNISEPQELSEYSVPNTDSIHIRIMAGAADGHYLYLTGDATSTTEYNSGVTIQKIDIAEPTQPQLVVGLSLLNRSSMQGMGVDIKLFNGIAYVAASDAMVSFSINDDTIYLNDFHPTYYNKDGIEIIDNVAYYFYQWENRTRISAFDITNPKIIRELGSCDVSTNYKVVLKDYRVSNGYAYFGVHELAYPQEESGVKILDLNSINSTKPNVAFIKIENFHSLEVYQNTLYIASYDTLYIYDVTDPGNPSYVNQYYISPWDYGNLNALKALGNYLYISTSNGLIISDILSPQTPNILGYYHSENGNYFGKVAIEGSYVYLPGTSLFDVIDVSNPSSLSLVKAFSVFGDVKSVSVAEGFVNIVSNYGVIGTQWFGDTLVTKAVYTAGGNGWAHRIVTRGSWSYVAWEAEGLVILKNDNLSNVGDENILPNTIELYQNYPNPFNPTTTINYAIPNVETQDFASLQNVTLRIYDILGREVATLVNKKQTPGKYSVQFDAGGLPSGVYFYTLRAGDFVQTRKMVLLK